MAAPPEPVIKKSRPPSTQMKRMYGVERLLNEMTPAEVERCLIYFCAVHGVAPKQLDAMRPGDCPP